MAQATAGAVPRIAGVEDADPHRNPPVLGACNIRALARTSVLRKSSRESPRSYA